MATKIVVPELGESVIEATVGQWLKKVGDPVAVGDLLVELQTDKVDLEVTADVAGTLATIDVPEDEDVEIGDTLGTIASDGSVPPPAPVTEPVEVTSPQAPTPKQPQVASTPVAKRIAEANGVDLSGIQGSGKGGKVTKADVTAQNNKPLVSKTTGSTPVAQPSSALSDLLGLNADREVREKMSRRRRTIAKRLVEAQQTAAMLTTFNEIDMSAVMQLRKDRKEWFLEKFGTKLGYTSFFTKASVAALKAFPRINAEIQGDDMILKNYYDIGIAVGAEEGLVVPVLRDADKMSFADIEKKVREFGAASRDGSLSLADLMGGTFTITNGGIFGSMLSTPILNAPQVAILGLHNIVERPVALNGEVVIRPIMYAALSYDHRIVDGREAVQFLYRIKELIEDPEDLLLAG